MLETGIGRAHNIALSTLPNFILPGDVTASKRYWSEDIIEPEVTVSKQGTIRVPDGPGIGFVPRLELIDARFEPLVDAGVAQIALWKHAWLDLVAVEHRVFGDGAC